MVEIQIKVDVEKVRDVGFGVAEAYLYYDGEATKRKMVLRNGKFVAIVSDKYSVIPNEYVDKLVDQIVAERQWRKRVVYEGRNKEKYYAFIQNGDIRYLVRNAIDGSTSLKVYVFRDYIAIPVKLKRKHVGVRMEKVAGLIQEFLAEADKVVQKFDEFLEEITKKEANVKDVREVLSAILPRKEWAPVIRKVITGEIRNWREVLSEASRMIWNNQDTQMTNKWSRNRDLLRAVANKFRM